MYMSNLYYKKSLDYVWSKSLNKVLHACGVLKATNYFTEIIFTCTWNYRTILLHETTITNLPLKKTAIILLAGEF